MLARSAHSESDAQQHATELQQLHAGSTSQCGNLAQSSQGLLGIPEVAFYVLEGAKDLDAIASIP